MDAHLLLEHAQWIRRLARALAGDAERADELSQETWKRVLERPPRLDRPIRGWLATVMRNLVHAQRRGAARRAAREAACARPEAEPSSHELLERATLQRELVQAVVELAEPYRTTVLLRYFEDRSPLEIAARDGLPVSTVKTRLARGLAQLRRRLAREQEPDGRTSVLAGLAAFAPRARTPWFPLTLTVLTVNKLALALVLVFASGVALLLCARRTQPPAPAVAPSQAESPAAPLAPVAGGLAGAPAERPAREAARAPAPFEQPQSGAPAAGAHVLARGRVVDTAQRPIAGLAVFLSGQDGEAARGARPQARSGPDGAFELELAAARGHLAVRDERWTTLLEGLPVESSAGRESLIVVAPRIELAGVVVDEFGLPAPGVSVRLEPPADLRTRMSAVLDYSAAVQRVSAADEAGRFRFADAPSLSGALFRIRADGFLPLEAPLPVTSQANVVLVLQRPELASTVLGGVVVDPANVPVAGALVSLGIDTTRTDERGAFSFQLDDPESFNRKVAGFITVDADVLRAVKPGYLPAELRARAHDSAGHPTWPASVVLRLAGEPLAIDGLVLDAREQPLAGVQVWLTDPTFFGGLRDAGGSFPRLTHLENVLAGAPPGWHSVTTDEQGRFELGGLLEREYDLAAMDPATLLRVQQEHVPAGSRNVRIVLDDGACYPELRGRVVDSHGTPLENATVFPMCDAFQTRVQGQLVGTEHAAAQAVRTDAAGRFELRRVPRDLVYLRIEAPDTLPLEWGREIEGGLASLVGTRSDDLLITVQRRCHFQVELEVADEADELGVLDAAGNELVIREFLGNSSRDTPRHPLVNGRSSTLATEDSAITLVLYRGGLEVRRVPIALTPGETALLRP